MRGGIEIRVQWQTPERGFIGARFFDANGNRLGYTEITFDAQLDQLKLDEQRWEIVKALRAVIRSWQPELPL